MSSCWDDCGYHWYEIGETSKCTRIIDDGVMEQSRMEVTPNSVSIDHGCTEPCLHEVECIVKIYEQEVGESETLVYESIDTVIFQEYRLYYKYNEWSISFTDVLTDPYSVLLKISHKDLCPGCTHNFVCDCEDTVNVGNYTYSTAPVISDPSIIFEKLQVNVISVTGDWEHAYIRVRVIDIFAVGGTTLYDSYMYISKGGFHDVSQGNMEYDWRVCCNDISPTDVDLQLCYAFEDSGEGSGSSGSGGLVVAQYFDTTNFGWSGGCTIGVFTEGHYAVNMVPTEIKMDLYEWTGDFRDSMKGVSLATDTLISPCEQLSPYNRNINIPFIWDINLPPGEYIWKLTCLRGPHDGSFGVAHVGAGDPSKWPCWVGKDRVQSVVSSILGIETDESWGSVMNINDTFGDSYYYGISGLPRVKVNSTGGYADAMVSKPEHSGVKRSPGIFGEILNPSFEDGDLEHWSQRIYGDSTISKSDEWSSDGDYSVKLSMEDWSGSTIYIRQYVNIINLAPEWKLMWDMYATGGGYNRLKISTGSGSLIYDELIINGCHLNMSASIPAGSGSVYVYMGVAPIYGYSGRDVYIDNIRAIPPENLDITPLGRIVGGSSNVRIM